MLFKKTKNIKNKNIFDVPAVLQDFYNLAHKLSNLRDVRFKELRDEGDELHWRFKYQGKKYVLQFSIYNGLSLMAADKKSDAENAALTKDINPVIGA